MKAAWKTMVALGILSSTTAVVGGEYYPKHPVLRLLGTDQGAVGDCAAEAEVTAFENAFLNHGYDVEFSLFYRHAELRGNEPAAKQAELMLAINSADQAFIARAGDMIPKYMWPEDGEGYNPQETGIRPHVSEAAVWDDEFPETGAFGFSPPNHGFQSFKRGFSNSVGNWSDLKGAVASGNPVVLSIHSALMQQGSGAAHWNSVTGLLETPYRWENVTKVAGNGEAGINHAVAVVGYDDSLYPDHGYSTPGAFIVRNSWNNWQELQAVRSSPSDNEKAALGKMRHKLYPLNLPGYYAIPYQYVIDMHAQSLGGYNVFSGINYGAYAEKYKQIQLRYEEVKAPFACEFDGDSMARQKVSNYAQALAITTDKKTTETEKRRATFELYQMALQETGDHHSYEQDSAFHFAKIARRRGQNADRVSDFYEGKLRDYYCFRKGWDGTVSVGKVWPNARHYRSAGFQETLTQLSSPGLAFISWEHFLRTLVELKAKGME